MLTFSKRILLIALISLSFGIVTLVAQGYEIKIKIKGVQNSDVILGHYLNKPLYPDDTVHVDKDGSEIFTGSNVLPEGLYVLFLPSSKTIEFIIGKDQFFSLETDTIDLVKNLVFQGSQENELFADFQIFMIDKQVELKKENDFLEATDNKKEKEKAKKRIEELTNERRQKIEQLNVEHPDLFIATFLKSTLDVEVPDPPKDMNGKIDSTWQYCYYRSHYFDNFNISDPRLLHTPLYEDKITNYLDNVAPQIPDTLIKEVDKIIDWCHNDSLLFKFVLITLFNKYGKSNIMGMDAVQMHIADKYYITGAWWSDIKFIDDLKERVTILKPLLLGKIAPDFQLLGVPADHFKMAENDTALKRYPHAGNLFNISMIDADFTVLLFWEATCSHCKKAVPDLYKIYKDNLEAMGVKVISISLLFGEDGKEKWVDFVNQHKLYDWINAWNPYDYQFKITYDVRSTPQIFILNRKKEIIGKRIGPEDITGLIKAYKSQFPNN
jgi:hypothetical protein